MLQGAFSHLHVYHKKDHFACCRKLFILLLFATNKNTILRSGATLTYMMITTSELRHEMLMNASDLVSQT